MLFLCKIQILQHHAERNKKEHFISCQTSQRIEDNPGMRDWIFLGDRAHCHLTEHVNKQNMRILAKA